MTRLDALALQDRAAAWHAARFPRCTPEDITLKSMAELGEVADAILAEGRDAAHPERAGTVLAEAADVLVTLLALCGRFGHGDLLVAVSRKLALLETPGGAHPGCLPEGPGDCTCYLGHEVPGTDTTSARDCADHAGEGL